MPAKKTAKKPAKKADKENNKEVSKREKVEPVTDRLFFMGGFMKQIVILHNKKE